MVGTLAGIVVGITGIFLPQVMFWGEAQLQTMIDQGRTPLPIFQDDGPIASLAAKAYCMVDQDDDSGFSLGCSVAIILAKIWVTGLSLGTGIVGGVSLSCGVVLGVNPIFSLCYSIRRRLTFI
jgi:H+/Cl- antiporter ClcA